MRSIRSVSYSFLTVLFILLLLADSGCPGGPSSSITVTDISGKKVELKAIPKRVVSLVLAATQTLCIDFTEPMTCLNSLSGSVSGITTVGNRYSSAPLWKRLHRVTIDDLKEEVCRVVGREPSCSSFLYTGARMDSLSIQKTHYKDMTVFALATAGVKGNAIRSGIDEGAFYEPGTVNIIILTNMR